MARPQKEGLIYFPLDVDMADDDKVILIQAQHGVTGFGILIRLLMELYRNGYYYAWTEREQLIFSNRVNVDLKTLREVISDALKWGFFHQKLYDEYGILTSRGIQKRYLEGTGRRKEVNLIREYLLLEPPDRDNIVITGIKEEPSGVNAGNNPVNVNINKQSKVKESRVQENTTKKDHVCLEKPTPDDKGNGEPRDKPKIQSRDNENPFERTAAHNAAAGNPPDKTAAHNYPADFETFWQAYPKSRRREKQAAFKAWQARLKQGKPQGLTVDKLIAAAEHYAAEMEALQREPKYIKLPKTFLGSNCPFEDYIKPPQKQGLDPPRAWVKLKKYINPKEVFNHDHG